MACVLEDQIQRQGMLVGRRSGIVRLVFVDVDTKVGKRGEKTFDLFDLLYGWPSTLVARSPSGGRHHWYRGRHLFALGIIRSKHPGIDFAQYVILPGCMKAAGTGYTF